MLSDWWIVRLFVGAVWGVVLALLVITIISALYHDPCDDDGTVTNRAACAAWLETHP